MIPQELVAVSLTTAAQCAEAGAVSLSWWYEEVRAGRAPAPAFRGVRCTRWRVSEVADFWRSRSEGGLNGAAKGQSI